MIARETDKEEWKAFLCRCPDATFYHTPEWLDLLSQSFPVQEHCIAFIQGGQTVGIFPYTVSKGLLYKALNSLPYSDYGGPLLLEAFKSPALSVLSRFLESKCKENAIACVRITSCDKITSTRIAEHGGTTDSGIGDVLLDLETKTPEHIWNKEFNSRRAQRQHIKRFEKEGFRMVQAENEHHLRSFYKLYWENLEFIKATPFPYRFFLNAWDSFHPGRFVILLAEKVRFRGGIGFFVQEDKRAVFANYAAIERTSLGTKFHMMEYLFWEAIKWAKRRNLRFFHFGTTPSDPTSFYYRQKMGFGGVFVPQYRILIPYNYELFKLREAAVLIWDRIREKIPVTLRLSLERK